MREFLEVRVLFEDEDFCSAFCKNCPAVKKEPVKWYCTACGWNLRDLNCLRRDAIKEIIEAIDECNKAINKAMELR